MSETELGSPKEILQNISSPTSDTIIISPSAVTEEESGTENKTEDTQLVTTTAESDKEQVVENICNKPVCDDENSTSDKEEEEEQVENDEEETGDEGTCSRSRPYVRRPTIQVNGTGELVPLPLKKKASIIMPAPPDEGEAEEQNSKTIKSLLQYTPLISNEEENLKTLHISPEGKVDTLRAERAKSPVKESGVERGDDGESDVKCDSFSTEDLSPERPVTTIIEERTKVPLVSPDHKDKRLASVVPTPVKFSHTSSGQHHTSKKGSKIPVGIAVAWQRFVTSNSALSNSSTTITSSAPSTTMSKQQSSKEKDKKHNNNNNFEMACPVKVPVRPSSASPINATKTKEDNKSVKKSSVFVGAGGSLVSSGKRSVNCLTPELTTSSSRPLPSSSVPPNLGLSSSSYFSHPQHSSLLDYRYEAMRSMSPYLPPQHNNGQFALPPTWQNSLGMGTDLNVPQGFTLPGGAYLQQNMQHQLQLQQQLLHQYSNYSSNHYLSLGGGYETLRHQYEQHIQHQQQSEFLRHLQHQQSQFSQQLLVSSGLYHHPHEALRIPPTTFPPISPRVSIPLLSPSPTTGGHRTPTPNSVLNPVHNNSLSMSNLSSATQITPVTQSVNWPTDLFHHNSSAALSPKSLTSSSPSPVTVQNNTEQSNFAVNTIAGGGGASSTFTGKSCSTTPSSLQSTSSASALKEVWKHASRKDEVQKNKHLSMSLDKDLDDKKDAVSARESPKKKDLNLLHPTSKERSQNPPITNEVAGDCATDKKNKLEVSSPPPPFSSFSTTKQTGNRNDFTRMDSLIEKRESDRDMTKVDESSVGRIVVVEQKVKANVPMVKVETTTCVDLKEQKSPAPGSNSITLLTSPPQPAPVLSLSNKKTGARSKAVVKGGDGDEYKKKRKPPRSKSKPKEKTRPVKLDFNENEANDKKPKKKVTKKSKLSESDSVSPKEKLEKAKKVPKTKTAPIKANDNTESFQLMKQAKPKVYKSKKAKESTEILSSSSFSCDPDKKGNKVPDLNLPVAPSSYSDTVPLSIIKNDNKSSCTDMNGLSPPAPLLANGKTRKERKKYSKKERKERNQSPKRKAKDEIFKEKVKRVKVEKVKVVKKHKTPVTIMSKAPTTIAPNLTTRVILPAPPISFATGGGVNLNQVNFSSPGESGSVCVTNVSSPVIPISVPYHNSPVTLILPRLLPQQSTITNSHHQTSFKLVVSSQEIKIPAFVPTSQGIATFEGTTQMQTFQLHHEEHQHQQHFQKLQNSFSSTSSCLQNVASTTTSTITSSSVLMSTPCDNELLASDRNNTITFIRDSDFSPSQHLTQVVGLSQNPLLSPSLLLSSPTHPIPSQVVRKDFLQPEDNHLNLLAAVAQEFGSREDLGKLASHSSSSRGSSLMTSPILSMQSPEVNYPTPSSTSMSSSTMTSISLPSSPLAAKYHTSKSLYDEYEYDDKEQGTNEVSLGSYKHPVWLKIPHIVPQVAKKAAEKLRKIEKRKQDKESKIQWSKVSQKIKSPDPPIIHLPKAKKENPKQRKKPVKGNEPPTNSKIKIPKISLTNSSGQEKSLSPKKKKTKIPDITEGLNPKKESENHSATTSIKMKLPVPKVAKIRIKLSETKNPSMMEKNNSPKTNLTLKNVQENIKRRHTTDGDKEKAVKNKKKANLVHYKADDDNNSVPPKNKPKQANNYSERDNNNPPLEKKKVFKSKNKPIIPVDSMKTTSTSGDLLFFPLTPPPTAKVPKLESQPSLFSLSNFQDAKDKSKQNWVSDPSFAASAFRENNLAEDSIKSEDYSNTIKVEKVDIAYDATSEEDEEENLMDFERRSAERMRLNLLSNKSSSTNINSSRVVNEKGGGESKSFVPYTPKRNKSRQHHHIKPCLKPEPIVRSSTSPNAKSDSDAETDFEVASLTNSIPRTGLSLLQQYRNKRKSQGTSGSGGSKSITTVIKHVTQNDQQQITTRQIHKRRLSSSTLNPKYKHFGRRLSLNLETGRTHMTHNEESEEDEELPDIGGDYSYTPHHHHYHQRSVKSLEGENKQHQRGNADKHRSVSGGSASTSASSASCLPKRLPKKRCSRSLTTSSRSSATGSVASVSNKLGGSRRSRSMREPSPPADVHMLETLVPGKVKLDSVEELLNEMRILTEIQGLFYTGKLNALSPPDVYGIVLDNERGAPPHLIFSAEEVLEKCVKEKKPQTLTVGLRICAYWSPQYSGLYPGRVSTDFNPSFDPETDLIPIEFDDGDTGMIKLGEIRMLPANHPIREYDPNPLLTLEKKHRKRRHSSANTNSGPCTGDHEEADCGESYCAKVAKLDEQERQEEEEEDEAEKGTHRPYKSMYWTWTGLGKRAKSKKTRNKEFFKGIQRGDEVISVGDSAIFISHGNERPYIGRIEKFWETKGQKVVNVRWFYHPEEVKSPKRIPHLKHTGALFESPHTDENDVQTIAKKCDVLSYSDFKERLGRLPKLSMKNSTSKPKDLYYVAGFYDPYNYNVKVKI